MTDAIRERHVEARSQSTGIGKGICAWCGDTGDDWPCDTRVVLDALTSQEDRNRIHAKRYIAQQDDAETAIADAVQKMDAARADADRLAEALGLAMEYGGDAIRAYASKGIYEQCREALRQHEAVR